MAPTNDGDHGMRLKDKVAMVTGAAGGIGSAIARRMAENGARVVLADLDAASVQAKVEELRGAGLDVSGQVLDVAQEAQWTAVLAAVVAEQGRLDILVNNAGVAARTGQPFDAIEFDDWRRVMSVNLDGVFLGCKAAVKVMKERRAGSIVNIASVAGYKGTRGGAAYGTSKGAVRTLTKQAAFSCAKHGYGIRINSIHPGYVWTDLVRGMAIREFGDEAKAIEALSASVPLGQLTLPDDIAWAAVYLASDEARMVTGSDLVIDGGALVS